MWARVIGCCCLLGCGRLNFDPAAGDSGTAVHDDATLDAHEVQLGPLVAGVAGDDWAVDVAATPDGGYVLVGANGSALSLWSGTVPFVGGLADAFILKLDASGAVSWVASCASSSDEIAETVAVDSAGNIYVGGASNGGGIDCGNGPITPTGAAGAWLASFTESGAYRWALKLEAPEVIPSGYWDTVRGIDISTDQVVIAGNVHGTIDFGAGNTSAVSSTWDAFVAGYGLDGSYRFARRYGGTGDTIGRDVAVDDLGQVYVAGEFGLTTDFGDGAVTSQGTSDVFVVALTSGGLPRWTTIMVGSGADRPAAVAVLGDQLHVGGVFDGMFSWASSSVVSAGGSDGFIAALSLTGGPRWLASYGSPSCDKLTDMRPARGKLVAIGSFGATFMLGGTQVTSSGGSDGIILEIDSGGALDVVATAGDGGENLFSSAAPTGDRRYVTVGQWNAPANPCGLLMVFDERDLYVATLP